MTCWLACSSRTPNAPLKSWSRSVSSVVVAGTGRGWNSFECMKTTRSRGAISVVVRRLFRRRIFTPFRTGETLGPLVPNATKHMQEISKDKKVSFVWRIKKLIRTTVLIFGFFYCKHCRFSEFLLFSQLHIGFEVLGLLPDIFYIQI